MLKVGITGGIGSGKSMVCQVFSTLGIPVFYADEAARTLMESDEELVALLQQLLGPDVYHDGTLDRKKVSALVFHNPELLEQVNALVHPATTAYAQRWLQNQQAPYVLKEAAIFFESGTYREMDRMIGVSAPAELRLKRTMKRGSMTGGQVIAIMSMQMDEEEKMHRCNHIVINDDLQPVVPQVLALHRQFLEIAGAAHRNGY